MFDVVDEMDRLRKRIAELEAQLAASQDRERERESRDGLDESDGVSNPAALAGRVVSHPGTGALVATSSGCVNIPPPSFDGWTIR